MERGVHKLALVSKLLLDKEVIQLRRENENLRLLLFWKDHNVQRLKEMMASANQSDNGPKCYCNVCAVTGRMGEDASEQRMDCLFKLWFESLLDQCGLIAVYHTNYDQGVKHDCDGWRRVHDVNTHFHHLIRGDWFMWTYGALLWKAKTADDPELAKLHALFQMLEGVIGEDD
jgi:hypothetical protein